MSGKSALVLGATGAVGKHVLQELIASNEFTRVGEFGRRVTPLEQLAPNAKDKLIQKTIDFEKIDEAGLRDGKWDIVFITLASWRLATNSAEMWEKIDRESKGLTENQLAELKYSDTIIFRPGYLTNAQRARMDLAEHLVAPIFGLASLVFSGLQINVSALGKSIVRSGTLGSKSLPPFAEARQATAPDGSKFTIIGTREAQKLADAQI